MDFPLLIKIESKRVAYVANSLNDLPLNLNFKIVKSQAKTPEDLSLDLPYKVVNDGVCKCPEYFHIKQGDGGIHCRACGLVVKESPLQTEENGVASKNDEAAQEVSESTGDSST